MIKREKLPGGKFEVFCKELETRSGILSYSQMSLREHKATLTDSPKIIDCVIGITENGMIEKNPCQCTKWGYFHFALSKASKNNPKVLVTADWFDQSKVLVTADWFDQLLLMYIERFSPAARQERNIQENINAPHESLIFVMMYDNCYYLFNMEELVKKHQWALVNVRNKYRQRFPCSNPETGIKMNNSVYMIPKDWGEWHRYEVPWNERNAIYRKFKNHADMDTTYDNDTHVHKSPDVKPGEIHEPCLPITGPGHIGNYGCKNISPLI